MRADTGLSGLSPWLGSWPEAHPALRGDREADVVVVGGGLTGLCSALELARESLDVVVLEAERTGYGASGRNAGHLTPTIGKDLPTLTRLHGRERVSALVGFSQTALAYVEEMLQRHAIECDYEPVGNVIAAVHPLQHPKIDRAAEAALAYGVSGELLDGAAMEARGLPSAFTRGYHEARGGVLDPGKYLLGLRAAALGAGVTLHEGSRVRAIREHGPRVSVTTDGGRVRARYVVLATNAYTPELPARAPRGVRLHVQLFLTRPLGRERLRDVGWQGRQGIYTAHEVLESYRLTRDGRILGGSKSVRVGYRDAWLPDVDHDCSRLLEKTFYDRFPELRGVAIERHWGGVIYSSADFLPSVGRAGRRGRLAYALAFNGHGVAHASYAGRMVADLLAGRDGPGTAVWQRRTWPLPPEPLRWLIVRGLLAAFSRMDRRVDRLAHGRPRSAAARRPDTQRRGVA